MPRFWRPRFPGMMGAGAGMKLKRAISDIIEKVTSREPPAVRVLRQDADRGAAHAQAALGDIYRKGSLVPRDFTEAAKWYRRAAEQGDAHAQFNLGASYMAGRGVPQDDDEAVIWYRRAAEQGDALAQFNLGAMYSSGRGVPQDIVQACMWLNLSASRGTQTAASGRNRIEQFMTPLQIIEARDRAREWKPAR